MQPLKLTSA